MNEKSEWNQGGESRRKLHHVFARLGFCILLAGKSTAQMNYSLSKQMFAACRDGDEQLDIVKESLPLPENCFLLIISHVRIHKDRFCYSAQTALQNSSLPLSHILRFNHRLYK